MPMTKRERRNEMGQQKINGHTVRGGWSRKYVEGEANGKKFTLWSADLYEVPLNKVRYITKKIEAGKIELPTDGHLFELSADGTIKKIN